MAMLLGFVAYGLSIFTYIRAQRTLGAAKTSAYYALAPFIAAFLSFAFVGEQFSSSYLIALVFMLIGTGIAVWDTMVKCHNHTHTHLVVHSHGGVTHTHVLEHSHPHNHLSDERKHGHRHTEKEIHAALQQAHPL